MKTKYKYIHFEKDGDEWICVNTKAHDLLAQIYWYKPWRRWVSESYSNSIFSDDCHDDISHFMKQLPKNP